MQMKPRFIISFVYGIFHGFFIIMLYYFCTFTTLPHPIKEPEIYELYSCNFVMFSVVCKGGHGK